MVWLPGIYKLTKLVCIRILDCSNDSYISLHPLNQNSYMAASNIVNLNGSKLETATEETIPVDKIIENFPHTPLDNRVVVLPDAMPKKTEGGLEIPDSAKVVMNRGTVIAKGPGKRTDSGAIVENDLSVGDHVMVDISRSNFLSWEGRDYMILYDHQVSLVLN